MRSPFQEHYLAKGKKLSPLLGETESTIRETRSPIQETGSLIRQTADRLTFFLDYSEFEVEINNSSNSLSLYALELLNGVKFRKFNSIVPLKLFNTSI